ncbi:hypothetical protein EOL70_14940 [Leucothrix sargassi]|nr:hypothetical protein EOL70_14940 [Leucothrix sargassi]
MTNIMNTLFSFAWSRCLACLVPFLLAWSAVSSAAQPDAFNNWAKTAKIGGAPVYVGMSTTELDTMLDTLKAQHVTVVEADSDLSNYLSDAQFELELALMRQVADAAHVRGMRVVWYIPALEVNTTNGFNIDSTMAKDHPEWLQIGLDGQQNVFYGGGGQVFWVPDDAESAWMSPSSTGYREYFFNRIKLMVATGIDGIWADVPIYADFGSTQWSDFNPEAIARFESVTGQSVPTSVNWNDASWKRWIHWRHEELARFLIDLTNEARSINSEFSIYAETLPTDYNGGTIYGLDAAFFKDVEGITSVWEVDTMSNNVGMRNARTDDWISFISALKYARAATGEKPSWTFTYGVNEDDAQQVMAQAMIAGNNPYELKVPEMATTVGHDFRSRMFNWSKVNAPYLFETETAATTAILFSSPSRDYVDQFAGLGMFATTDGGDDELWWSESTSDSVYERNYLAEHRGVLKVLVNEHIPFNILLVPSQAELNQYQTVFLPNVEAISDEEANRLRAYVNQGGHLIVTGPNPTGMDQYGNIRSSYALADLLGFDVNDTQPSSKVQNYGAGQTHYFSTRLGKEYLTSGSSSARTLLANKVRNNSDVAITTNANDSIYVESTRIDQQAVLQFTNFIGLNGTFSVTPTNISVTYTIPTGESVTGVTITNPDTTNTARTALNYTQSGNTITFNVPLTQYALVVVSFNGAQTPSSNHVPAAGNDYFTTDLGTALTFSATTLLANDGDLDGDTVSVSNVYATSASNGTVSNLGSGNYRYTPNAGVVGTDSLIYTATDNQGGQTVAQISISVGPQPTNYYPASINISQGIEDSIDVSYFTNVDEGTFDITSIASGSQNIIDWNTSITIAEDIADISEINITQVGQYSAANTTHRAYVYNYANSAWEQFDTAVIGDEYMHPSAISITSNVSNYISASKQVTVRFRGVNTSGEFYSWTDQLVIEVVPVTPTPSTPVDNGSPSNPVSSGRFTIDGNLGDWAGLASFGVDGDDISTANAQVDWLEGWMAHDNERLYIAYENDGAINTATWWPWAIYLDTDTNTNSGFKINNAMGADYLFDGWSIYRYTGTGTNWSWEYVVSDIRSTAQGNFAEASIPRTAIGNPTTINAFFVGDNTTFVGTQVVDTYPNGWDAFHAYSLNGGAPTTSVYSNTFTPTLDSVLNDWASVTSFGDDGVDISMAGAQADWRTAWMAHDSNNIYLAYENEGTINNSLRWAWQVFIDTDANASTGFSVSPAMGASYMVQGNSIYQYSGSGTDWSWTYLSSASSWSTSNLAELNFPRSVLGGANDLRIVFRAANWPFTGDYDAAGYDYFPNAAATDSSSYFSYKVQ